MPTFTLKDFRQEMPGKYRLVPHLERAIQNFDEEWTFTYVPKEHDLYWHPSSDCVPPPSALYESAIRRLNDGHENPDAKRIRKYGFVGHFWHQYLQHLMVRYNLAKPEAIERKGVAGWSPIHPELVYTDTEWRPFHACVGSSDVAPANVPRHGDYLVDFKTMASGMFKQVALPEGFKAKYECQINIYMDLFGYDKALIVAINKDTPHDMKEFEYRRNDELVEAIYNKWKFVAECLEHNDPPSDLDDAAFVLNLEAL